MAGAIGPLENKTPAWLPYGSPSVRLWATLSLFVQVTVSPGEMFTMLGLKHVLVCSQFCPEPEPGVIVTWTVAAKAEGIVEKIPKTRTRDKMMYWLLRFILDVCRTYLKYMTLIVDLGMSLQENKFPP